MSNIKLKLDHIYKFYGKKQVIQGLDLEVDDGEFMVVLGPSGMGKSTLLRVIVGIEELSGGRILLDGRDISGLPPNKRDIAMVFQNYALYPNMTVYENISFPLKMTKVSRHDGSSSSKPTRLSRQEIRKKVEQIAETLRIADVLDRNVTMLSGGQKQRVALARCLVRDPKMFLLDEPLSNLDARVRYTARSELKKIQKELGYTFVYVTHDQSEAASLSDRVAVLRDGKIEQLSSYEDLMNKPHSRWLGDFVGDYPMNFIDGRLMGMPGYEIGFRHSWTEEGKGGLTGRVDFCQVSEDIYTARVTLDENRTHEGNGSGEPDITEGKDTVVTIRVSRRYGVNDPISFRLKKYNLYKDGVLSDSVGF